jgi:hypothetical protein
MSTRYFTTVIHHHAHTAYVSNRALTVIPY